MAESSFPFTDGGGGDDGAYSAPFFAQIFEELFSQNNLVEGSYLVGSGSGFDALDIKQTSPLSKSVELKIGSAFIQGYYYNNSAVNQLLVTNNTDGSGWDRIDVFVLEIDFTAQTVRAKIIAGTPSASPVAPTLTKTASIYQVALAEIAADNLFTQIVDADITTTVRTPSYAIEEKHGGTGIQAYATGDVIVAQAADDLIIQNIANYRLLMRDTGEANDFIDVPLAGATFSYTTAYNVVGASLTANAWTTHPFNNLEDLSGIFSSNVGGIFTIAETGEYELVCARHNLQSRPTGGATGDTITQLYNITSATILAISKGFVYASTAETYPANMVHPVQFSAAAGDEIEIRTWRDGGNVDFGIQNHIVADSANQEELYSFGIIRRIH